MKKKANSKKKSHKKRRKTHHAHSVHVAGNPANEKIEKVLIENFVSLQKVMTNISIKFDNLSTQISKLLELFEISAKALVEKDFSVDKNQKDANLIMEKMDNLLEQNKTIAKGLTLVHERIPPHDETQYSPPSNISRQGPPQMKIPQQTQNTTIDVDEYQKSISSGQGKFNRLPKK